MVQKSSRYEHARDLAQRGRQIAHQVERAVHDHHVERRILDAGGPQILGTPLRERKGSPPIVTLRMIASRLLSCVLNAILVGIDSQNEPIRPYQIGNFVSALAAATQKIQHALARKTIRKRHLAAGAVPLARQGRIVALPGKLLPRTPAGFHPQRIKQADKLVYGFGIFQHARS